MKALWITFRTAIVNAKIRMIKNSNLCTKREQDTFRKIIFKRNHTRCECVSLRTCDCISRFGRGSHAVSRSTTQSCCPVSHAHISAVIPFCDGGGREGRGGWKEGTSGREIGDLELNGRGGMGWVFAFAVNADTTRHEINQTEWGEQRRRKNTKNMKNIFNEKKKHAWNTVPHQCS